MSDANDVVYSYTGDTTGIMDSLGQISEGIQGLIEDINALVDASSGLSDLDGVFSDVAASLAAVDDVAAETTMAVEEMSASAGEASAQIEGLQEMVDQFGGALAEDTALIDSLNETIINLQAQIDMLTASEAGATASTDALSVSVTGLKAAQGPLMMLGMAGIAAGASMYDMGSKAEDALNQVQALAGVGASDMATYTSELEDQATQFSETLDQEAQGLFYVTSAGFQNADAMKVLGQAVEDAKAGHVDLSVSAKALDASLNAYGATANDATHYNDIMMTAVTKGVQTFGDFASAISKAAIAGNSAHISFDQVAAAESELTTVGMTARQASMDLSSMMKAMDSNADATAKSAKGMGLSFNEAAYKSMDLFHQMSYLKEITKGNQTELTTLVGGSAGIAAFNGLMTQNADGTYKFAQSLENMKNSSGAAANAFATSQDTIGAHWAKVQASLSVISYKALEALAPTINAVADAFGKAADFLSQHMDIVMPILAGFAVLIGTVVVTALWSLLSALGGVALTVGTISIPFLAIGAVIAAVVAGIIYAIEHWGQIVGWLQGAWSGVTGFFSGLWQNLRSDVSDVGSWFKNRWQDATNSVVDKFSWLYDHNYFFKDLTDSVKSATTNASNFLKGAWQTASTDTVNTWNSLKAKASQLWDEISTPFKNAWSQYIAPPLNSLWNNIKGLWDGFVTNAGNLGKNLVQSIADGISSKAGEAGQAAQNIGNRIATLLGFHNIAGMAQKSGGDIVSVVRTMGTNMLAAAQQAGANLKSWWNGLAAGFTNSPIGGAIVKTLQDAFGQVGQQFGQIGQTIRTQFGDALSGVKPAFDNLSKSFGLVWQDLSSAAKLISGPFAQAWQILQASIGPIGQLLSSILVPAWKQVQGALTQVGQIISATIGPFWKALQQQLGQVAAIVGGALSTAWKALAPIFAQIGGGVGAQLLNVLKMIGIVLGGIVLIAISFVLGAIVGLAKAFATLVGGIAMVIGGIVKVFSGVMQIASGIVAFLTDLFTGHFNKLGADLGTIWHGIVTMFSGLWDILKGLFMIGVQTLVDFISGFVTTVINFFVHLWDSLVGHSIIPDMINGIVSWFEQLPGRALTFVEHLVNSLTTTLGGLGAKALTWAGDMISQFVQGIENGIGAVGNAVQKIAGKISSFLHFSKPDVGPLVDVDNWMPDFMTLLSKGIDDNLDKLKGSALNIATTVSAAAPNAASLPQGPNAASSGNTAQSSQMQQQMLSALQGIQRQQLSASTSATLGAMTQQFNNNTFNGVNDLPSLIQALERILGQNFNYGQRGANFNTF